MWDDLGMDLENHDLLCQVLPTAVGDVFLTQVRREAEKPPRASIRERLKQAQEKAEKKPPVQAAPKKKVPER